MKVVLAQALIKSAINKFKIKVNLDIRFYLIIIGVALRPNERYFSYKEKASFNSVSLTFG